MISSKTLIAIGLAALPLSAMAVDSKNQGYLVDQKFDVVPSGTGLCWRTSDWTPARAAAAAACQQCTPDLCAPTTVAQAPAQQPLTPRAEPAKPAQQRFSFSADALFAFDKAVLKPEGKVLLDGLVQQLSAVNYDNILAIGHSDRIGSAAYNQKLSVRRASAVKSYLVSKNISANRITVEGRGETQPVTKTGDCKGPKSKKLIACLQPDRRVDVEVSGVKNQ